MSARTKRRKGKVNKRKLEEEQRKGRRKEDEPLKSE